MRRTILSAWNRRLAFSNGFKACTRRIAPIRTGSDGIATRTDAFAKYTVSAALDAGIATPDHSGDRCTTHATDVVAVTPEWRQSLRENASCLAVGQVIRAASRLFYR